MSLISKRDIFYRTLAKIPMTPRKSIVSNGGNLIYFCQGSTFIRSFYSFMLEKLWWNMWSLHIGKISKKEVEKLIKREVPSKCLFNWLGVTAVSDFDTETRYIWHVLIVKNVNSPTVAEWKHRLKKVYTMEKMTAVSQMRLKILIGQKLSVSALCLNHTCGPWHEVHSFGCILYKNYFTCIILVSDVLVLFSFILFSLLWNNK